MITILIIVFTSFLSYQAFNNSSLLEKWIFYPPAVNNKQWYRLITYGWIHADWSHLIFNMFSLYLFGSAIEKVFKEVFGQLEGIILFILLYFFGLIFSILPTWYKERHNNNYSSLGASGAVSAIVFAYILIYPMSYMSIIFIPVFLPAFLFGIIYVVVSVYMEKNQNGNVNHLAHIAGGLFGLVFMAVSFGTLADINLLSWFLSKIEIHSIRDLFHFGYY